MEKKNNGILIGLLIGIILMLLVLIVLFETKTINFNTKETNNNQETSNNKAEEDNDTTSNNENTTNNKQDNKITIINKLKEKLTDETWIKENLYSKKNCFGQDVNNSNQELKFEVLEDNEKKPIVIVSDYSFDNFIVVCYKVYVENNEVIVKNVDGKIGHPSHVGYSIDKEQNLVVSNWGHMGDYKFSAYDVKNNEIKLYDEYECSNCEYEYKGDKKYNLSEFSKELTKDNIETYLK